MLKNRGNIAKASEFCKEFWRLSRQHAAVGLETQFFPSSFFLALSDWYRLRLKDLLIKTRKNSILYRAGTKCGHLADTGRRILYRILTLFSFFYLRVITMTTIIHMAHESPYGYGWAVYKELMLFTNVFTLNYKLMIIFLCYIAQKYRFAKFESWSGNLFKTVWINFYQFEMWCAKNQKGCHAVCDKYGLIWVFPCA